MEDVNILHALEADCMRCAREVMCVAVLVQRQLDDEKVLALCCVDCLRVSEGEALKRFNQMTPEEQDEHRDPHFGEPYNG